MAAASTRRADKGVGPASRSAGLGGPASAPLQRARLAAG